MIGHRLPRLAMPLLAGVVLQACATLGPAPDPASPFFTIEPDALTRYQSLALAKKVIEAHDGRIWVESERGKGTTVCLHLPFPLKRRHG